MLLKVHVAECFHSLHVKGLHHGDRADFSHKLSWKLVVPNLIHSEHFLCTFKGRYNLTSQREDTNHAGH